MKWITGKGKMICILLTVIVIGCSFQNEQVFASSVNKEGIITDISNPSNGVIKYNVSVPPGERIDYSVELTPDKKAGTIDKVSGSWKNKTRKTVKKAITVRVKYLSNKYKIKASYSKTDYRKEIRYQDIDQACSSLKKTTYTTKVSWDFAKLGKGNKKWTYRYKYIPYKDGYKKYLQVFNENGRQIQNSLKQIVPITKISKIVNEMKSQ